MKITDSTLLECLHLDSAYLGLTVNNLMVISESFNLLDVHNDELLNDLQVKIWMKHNTDLRHSEVVQLFELMDVYSTGFFDLDTFYFFTTIMLAAKDNMEKDYINRHSRTIYNLFEARMRGKMTYEQFRMVGWLFGYEPETITFFRKNFDVPKGMRIFHDEFRLYALICLELQRYRDTHERIMAYQSYRRRLISGLHGLLVHYVKYNETPKPTKVIRKIRWTQKPYIKTGRGVRRLNILQRIHKYCLRRIRILMETLADQTKCCSTCLKRCCHCCGMCFNISTCHHFQSSQQKQKQKTGKKRVHDDPENDGNEEKKEEKTKVKGKKSLCNKAKQSVLSLRCGPCSNSKCCKKSKSKRTGRPRKSLWGEEVNVVKQDDKHEEVSEASRMPSWIVRLDEIKKKSRKRGVFTFDWGHKTTSKVQAEDHEEDEQVNVKKTTDLIHDHEEDDPFNLHSQ